VTRAKVALLVASLAGLAAVAVLVVACPPANATVDPAAACLAVIDCYFTPNASVDEAALHTAIPEFGDDPQLFINTYGTNGQCWSGGPALAHSCEDRCRGLLSQDCVRSFAGPGAAPICPQACRFPEECTITAANGVATQPVCPATNQTKVVNRKTVDVPEPCTAPAPKQGQISFGCCLGPGSSPVVDCQYTYPNSADCRDGAVADTAICTVDGARVALGDAGPAEGEGEGEGQ
jgi:hypothetical protein